MMVGKTKKYKIFLLAVIAVAVIITGVSFWEYRQVLNKSANIISSVQNKASITIGNFQQKSTKNGREEWSLNAGSAHFISEKKQVILENPSVVFFSKDGDSIYLTANHGILKTDSNDIEVRDNVVIKNKNYMLETENLQYDHKTNMFLSKFPVKITGPEFHLVAGSMSFDLNTNQAVFKGSVKGVFNDNITL